MSTSHRLRVAFRARVGLPVTLAVVLAAVCVDVDAQPRVKTVLTLQFGAEDSPERAIVRTALERTVQARYGLPVDCFVEFLGPDRLWGDQAARAFRDYIRSKYRNRPIDVLIADGSMTLDFVEQFRDELFANVPVVYSALTAPDPATASAGAGMTGIELAAGVRETVRLALSLHPAATHVAVVAETRNERVTARYEETVRAVASRIAPGIDVRFLRERSLPLLLGTARALPSDTILIYISYFGDDPQRSMSPAWAERVLASELDLPVYIVSERTVPTGVVGGIVSPRRQRGVAIGNLATRVLAGARPRDIAPIPAPLAATFDWQGMHRWNIDRSRLPVDADVRFVPATLWEEHRQSIVVALAIVTLQGLMIASLVFQRGRRREVEKALRESQQRYAMATAAGGVGVWDWNVDTNEIFVDPSLKSLLGYQDHEIRNHMDHWATFVHPDDVPAVMEKSQRHLRGETPAYVCERRMLHRDGSVRWFLARGTAVRTNGRAERVVGTDTDITDRKQAEHTLQDAQDELARVSRLTALGEFAASIAHEVRQPLTTILTAARAAARFLDMGNTPETGAALAQVVDAAKRADQVVQRNRQLFRSNTVQTIAVDVNRLVVDSIAVLHSRLQAAHIVPVTWLDPDLDFVAGDPVELQQVLLNLIVNGIDAMDHLPQPKRRLELVTMSAPGGLVHVSVSDRGIGLDGVDTARMFTLSYTTKAHGTGVGLSISRSIVEAHGGRLWAERNNAGGATFTFSVPVYEAAPAQMSAGS